MRVVLGLLKYSEVKLDSVRVDSESCVRFTEVF